MAVELEILQGRRAFPETQRLWAALSPAERIPRQVDAGWHVDYDLDQASVRETGSFAVVRRGGPYEDLRGEFLRVTAGQRSVTVYCIGTADVPPDLSLTRRAFLELGGLWQTRVPTTVLIVR